MVVVDQPEHHHSGVSWHVIEERPQFEILQRRRLLRGPPHGPPDHQYRLRTRWGRPRYVLAESPVVAEIYADLTVLEAGVGDTDTEGWDLEAWRRAAHRAKQIAASQDPAAAFARHNVHPEDAASRSPSDGNSARSAFSEGGLAEAGDPYAPAEVAGRFLHGLRGQYRAAAALVQWADPIRSAGALLAGCLAWLLGLSLELLLAAALHGMARAVEESRGLPPPEGQRAHRRATEWLAQQVQCMEHPSTIPLSTRVFILPTLLFVVCKWVYPPAFSLAVLVLPFAIGAAHRLCPSLRPHLHPAAVLLLPAASAAPASVPSSPLTPRAAPVHCPPAAAAAAPSRPHADPPGHPRASTDGPPETNGGGVDGGDGECLADLPDHAMGATFVVRPPSRVPIRRGAFAFPEPVVRLVEVHLGNGWELVREGHGVVLESKAVPWSDTKAFRLTTAFACPLDSMGSWFLGRDNIYKTDPLIEKRMFVETLDPHQHVIHNRYKSPMFAVSRRDAVLQMCQIALGPDQAAALGLPARRTFIDASSSCEHPACPPDDAYIRSKVYCGGFICQEEGPGTTSIVNMGCASPEGWIPAKVVDAVTGKLTGKLDALRKCVEASRP